MGMLARLIKTAISAFLLNKAMRSAFAAALIKSLKWTLQPSRRSGIMVFFTKLAKSVPRSASGGNSSNLLSILFKGAMELLLLRFAKRSGFLGPAALSALAALLLGSLRGREENSDTNSKSQRDQVIDHDDYTILDDRH